MAEFFKMTTKQLPMGKNVGVVGINGDMAKGNGPANSKLPKADHKVGAHGDNAASNSSDAKALKDMHKVGATGDNAAKTGTGA